MIDSVTSVLRTESSIGFTEHGGNVQYEYTPSNPILEKYGQPQPESTTHSRAPSTNVSSASLKSEVFHSAGENSRPGTPSLSRRTSGLVMTTANKASPPTASTSWFGGWGKGTKKVDTEAGTGSLRRVRSLAELQAKLEETQRELDSEDSVGSEDSDAGEDDTQSEYAGGGTGESGYPSTSHSRRSSRFSSRATSRATSREASPARRRGLEPLSTTDSALSDHAMQTMVSRVPSISALEDGC